MFTAMQVIINYKTWDQQEPRAANNHVIKNVLTF